MEIKAGMRYKGNVNGAIFEVVKIENKICGTAADRNDVTFPTTVIVKDCKTDKTFQYGLQAFKRCDLTILE